MNFFLKAAIGSLGLLLVTACGRTQDDADGSGGAGGKPGIGGQGTVGGSGGLHLGGTSGSAQGGSGAVGGISGAGGSIVSEGDAGEGGTSGAFVSLGESSWDTKLALTVTKSTGSVNVKCTAADFTLHFSPLGDRLKAISGRDGAVMAGELVRSAQGSPTYSVSQALQVPTRGDCDLISISITDLTLQASDADGDGTADSIRGRGKANGFWIVGDTGLMVELGLELQGVPDKTKPLLLAPSNLHPLDGVYLRTSEPVALTSTVTLTSAGTGSASEPLTGYTASEGALRAFSTPVILPFGSSWTLTATGGDLANLPFDTAALPPLAVLADPGLFAQDGFESSPTLSLTGDAKIVPSIGTLPAITGNQSLFVPVGASATLHLARPSSAGYLRFKAQALMSSSGAGGGNSSYLQAGVIGGSEHVQPTQALPTSPTTTTSDSKWQYAGPKQDVALLLTDSGPDVAIRIALPTCQGLCPPAQALLIDELRVE